MENRGTEYNHLDKFIGKWNTEGTVLPTTNNPELKIKGTDTYEWLPGGFFLLHKVDVFIGDDNNQTFEIIGFHKLSNHYTMQHYDNKGNSGCMTATFKEGVWNFLSYNLRFIGRFSNDENVLSGIWEQTTNGKTWKHFMEVKLIKENLE